MHELSIAQKIVEKAEQVLEGIGAKKVLSIRLKIGELSSVNKENLEFCYNVIISDKERLKESKLLIEEIEWIVKCRNCGFEYNPNINLLQCKKCGSNNFILVSGNELDLIDMEVE